MEDSSLKELIQLKNKFQLSVQAIEASFNTLIPVRFICGLHSWELYIEDEYGYFNVQNQTLCVFLVLRSLEDYQESRDYSNWCHQYGIDSSKVVWQQYYERLKKVYLEVSNSIGEIDSIINPMDFQLSSGDFAKLLNM